MRFIGRFFWLVFTVMVAIISMAFAASNDSEVVLFLWPVDKNLTLPVWLAVLGAFGAGIMTGGLIVWLSTIAIRTRCWHAQKKLKKIEKQMSVVDAHLASYTTKPSNDVILAPEER